MNLLDLVVKITCADEASAEVSAISSKISSGIQVAATAAAAAATAVAAGVVTIGASALKAYANYEQLVGGVETLFKSSSDTVQQYAAEAYKNAGVSANTYMEQATAFSASLIQSLGGDTEAAANYANTAINDMSDNANKMGTSIESIQDTYQSLMRGNYAMLDNLKLGYGGTKSELERLVADAEKLTGQALDPSKFSDVITAIHAVQENLGITGTTALEASTTIEGSVNTMKAAWENWLAGLGTEDADMQALTDQLVESVITAASNVIPRIGQIGSALWTSFTEQAPQAMQQISDAVMGMIPEEARSTIQGLLDTFNALLPVISGVIAGLHAFQAATAITAAVQTAIGAINAFRVANEGLRISQILVNAVMAANPFVLIATLIATVVAALITLWMTNEDFRNAVMAAWTAISAAASAVWGAIVNFFTVTVPGAINTMVSFFSSLPGIIGGFLSSVVASIASFVASVASNAISAGQRFLSGIQSGFNSAVSFVSSIPSRILSALGNLGSLLVNAGKSVLDGFLSGLQSAWNNVTGFFSSITSQIPSLKGPEDVDRKLLVQNGIATMSGYLSGLEKSWGDVEDFLQEKTDNLTTSMNVKSSYSAIGTNDTTLGEILTVLVSLYKDLPGFIEDYTPTMTKRQVKRFLT